MASAKSAADQYSLVSVSIHWATAALVFAAPYLIGNLRRISLFVITTSLFASSVSAQSLHPLHQYGERDIHSSINLTIPFGGQPNAATSKPQFNLSVQQHRLRQNPYNFVPNNIDVKSSTYNLQPRQARIGFTLDQQPQLMMNGKPYELPQGTANASTMGKVGIGAAVIGGIVVIAFGALLIATAASDPAE